MARKIVESKPAIADVIRIDLYLIEHGDEEVASRFARALEKAYKQLAVMPEIGAVQPSYDPDNVGLRMWRVPEYRNYLIFYQATGRQLVIRRVLQQAQNARDILDLV